MTYNKTADQSAQTSASAGSQARGAFAITPDNANDLTTYAKALYIGGTGDVAFIPVNQVADTPVVILKAHPVGYAPIQARRIMSTGTTATNIVGLCNQS